MLNESLGSGPAVRSTADVKWVSLMFRSLSKCRFSGRMLLQQAMLQSLSVTMNTIVSLRVIASLGVSVSVIVSLKVSASLRVRATLGVTLSVNVSLCKQVCMSAAFLSQCNIKWTGCPSHSVTRQHCHGSNAMWHLLSRHHDSSAIVLTMPPSKANSASNVKQCMQCKQLYILLSNLEELTCEQCCARVHRPAHSAAA